MRLIVYWRGAIEATYEQVSAIRCTGDRLIVSCCGVRVHLPTISRSFLIEAV